MRAKKAYLAAETSVFRLREGTECNEGTEYAQPAVLFKQPAALLFMCEKVHNTRESEDQVGNSQTPDGLEKLVFIVGSKQEVGAIERAGYRAITEPENELALTSMERRGEFVILHLGSVSMWRLSAALEAAGVPYYEASIDGYTDDTGAWADREAANALEIMAETRRAAQKKMLQALGVHDTFDVVLQLASGEADRKRIPTGLESLDKELGGGFPEGGLVILGATSSTGKTTLALQWADNMAASGRPVLFVTVEQGRHELVAKSISRLMRLTEKRFGWYVASASSIQDTKEREAWDAGTARAFDTACSTYSSTIAPNLHVMELEKQPSTAEIRKAAEAISRSRGVAPCVIVDYLQLLRPANDRMTERQAVDYNVMDLRHLARDLHTCVIAISSLNRSSYSEGASTEAFKESGAIEYGSDILMGMQPRDFEKELEEVTETKRKRAARKIEKGFKSKGNRMVEIVVLKNRGGMAGMTVPLDYDAVSNLFTVAKSADGGKEAGKGRRPAFL